MKITAVGRRPVAQVARVIGWDVRRLNAEHPTRSWTSLADGADVHFHNTLTRSPHALPITFRRRDWLVCLSSGTSNPRRYRP